MKRMPENENISKSHTVGQLQLNSSYSWILVATLPFLFQLPLSVTPVWAMGLIVGGLIANKHILRWIALAWILSIFFPLMPLLLLACCGMLLMGWRQCIYAAVLGSTLILIPILGELKNMGTLLIITGLILMIYQKVK